MRHPRCALGPLAGLPLVALISGCAGEIIGGDETDGSLIICPETVADRDSLQPAGVLDELRDVTARAEAAYREYLAAGRAGGDDSSAREDLRRVLIERKRLLELALGDRTSGVAPPLLAPRTQQALAALTEGCVEEAAEVEGAVATRVEDDFFAGTARTSFSLRTPDGREVRLHAASVGDEALLGPGSAVRARGLLIGDELVVGPGEITPAPTARVAPGRPIGEMKALVILASYTDARLPDGYGAEEAEAALARVDAYWREASYGKAWLGGEVVGPVELGVPRQGVCNDTSVLATQAVADDRGITYTELLNSYNQVIVVAPFDPYECQFGGSTLFDSRGVASMALVLPDGLGFDEEWNRRVWTHELGHTLGLGHSSFWYCGEASLRYPGQYPDCYMLLSEGDYGDRYSVMGNYTSGHVPASQKERAGWLGPGELVEVTESGVFTVGPYEEAGGGPKALAISHARYRSPPDFSFPLQRLYVEYRQPIGFDAGFGPGIYQGGLLHLGLESKSSLIDASAGPGNPGSAETAELPVGATFVDPFTGTRVTTLAATPEGLTVEVALGKTDFTPPDVALVAPTPCTSRTACVETPVSGRLTIRARATDDGAGVGRVELHEGTYAFYGQGHAPFAVLEGRRPAGRYMAVLDTTALDDGARYVWVLAEDRAGEPWGGQNNAAFAWAAKIVIDNLSLTVDVGAAGEGGTPVVLRATCRQGNARLSYSITDASGAVVAEGTLRQRRPREVLLPAGSYTVRLTSSRGGSEVKQVLVP